MSRDIVEQNRDVIYGPANAESKLVQLAEDLCVSREAVAALVKLCGEKDAEITRLRAELAASEARSERLSRFVDFANLWTHRGPPHGGPGNEAQCLDAIRNHPALGSKLT